MTVTESGFDSSLSGLLLCPNINIRYNARAKLVKISFSSSLPLSLSLSVLLLKSVTTKAPTMTTAAGEHTPLPPRFAALAIADPPEHRAPFALASSSSSCQEELPSEANGVGRRGGAAADAVAPRKAWRSPPRRVPDEGEVAFMEELGSSWPVPSRGGPSNKKKHPQHPQNGRLGIPIAAPTAAAPAAAAAASDSSPESASVGDPIIRSAAICAPVDPRQKKQKEKEAETWGAEKQTSDSVAAAALPSKANNNSRTPRPPYRPAARQQQARPPMQNIHRGRNQQHFLGNGGNHQQQRPRHQRNTGFFPHQQPTQVINDYGYQSAMTGLLNHPPEWGFNPSSNLQWGPNPQIAPPRMNTFAPPETMFLRGYFPGPYYPDGVSYCAPPFPPILRPPLGQNPPSFMAPPPPPPPPPPLAEATLQNQPAPLLPPDDHQLPPEITKQEAGNVSTRLRKQIEYYFSYQNLVKDVYLRTCMDNEGWISVHTIANFPRVQSLTRDVGLILAALQTSPSVEVSEDKMRRKGEWRRWIIQRQSLLDASRGEPSEG